MVSKMGGWPHAYFMISTPPVAFLWVPKHVVPCHIAFCPHTLSSCHVAEDNLQETIFLAQRFPHAEHGGSLGTRSQPKLLALNTNALQALSICTHTIPHLLQIIHQVSCCAQSRHQDTYTTTADRSDTN